MSIESRNVPMEEIEDPMVNSADLHLDTDPETLENRLGTAAAESIVRDYKNGLDAITKKQARVVLEKIENLAAYQHYKHDMRVRFDTLDSLLDDFDQVTADLTDKIAIAESREYLAEKIEGVQDAANRYYKKILEIDHFKRPIVRMRMEDREHAEELASKDRSRRIVHDQLLSELRILWRISRVTLANKFGETVKLPSTKLFHTDSLAHENRTSIGSWAVNAVIGHNLDVIGKKAREIIKKEDEEAGA